MEQAVSRRKKIIKTPAYNDSRAKLALWNNPQMYLDRALQIEIISVGFLCLKKKNIIIIIIIILYVLFHSFMDWE